MTSDRVLTTNFEILKDLRCYLTAYMDSLLPTSLKNSTMRAKCPPISYNKGEDPSNYEI